MLTPTLNEMRRISLDLRFGHEYAFNIVSNMFGSAHHPTTITANPESVLTFFAKKDMLVIVHSFLSFKDYIRNIKRTQQLDLHFFL